MFKVDDLKPDDRVAWRSGKNGNHIKTAIFVRLPRPHLHKLGRTQTIIVRDLNGKELRIEIWKLLRACRYCGCSEESACHPPCHWVGPRQCSACKAVEK